ncbi:MAG: helix-turn-helix transcriptional regulator [Halanaerobiales bacterium]|nr:helix-turn-helix transcriptional regulator [Halanaerobiales bacterium]
MDFYSIGQKLRKLRKRKRLTLTDVGKAIDKSMSLIGSIERADRCPSLSSLIDLAEFYQIPLAFLFEDDLYQKQQEIGEYLKKLLIEKDYTIADLAKKTEINYLQLVDFFQGRGSLTLDQLKSISTTLNISIKKIIPHATRYINHIKHYLEVLGIDEQTNKNIIEYIYSKFEE